MPRTWKNPVFPGYFADPAVLRASNGRYYAFGTGHGPERETRKESQPTQAGKGGGKAHGAVRIRRMGSMD